MIAASSSSSVPSSLSLLLRQQLNYRRQVALLFAQDCLHHGHHTTNTNISKPLSRYYSTTHIVVKNSTTTTRPTSKLSAAKTIFNPTRRNLTTNTANTNTTTNTNNTMIVVLMGWLGAQPRHLKKYEAIYQKTNENDNDNTENKSYTTKYSNVEFVTTITPNLAVITASRPLLQQAAQSVLKDVSGRLQKHHSSNTSENEKIPVVFHAFSNGGGLTLHAIEELLESDDNEKNNKDNDASDIQYIRKHAQMAQIWDSAPAFTDYQTFMLAIEGGFVAQPKPVQWLAKAAATVMAGAYILWYGGEHKHPGITWYYNGRKQASAMTMPQLYIYSQGDAVTRPDKVEEVIQATRQLQQQEEGTQGNENNHDEKEKMTSSILQVKKFDNSEHILHYRKYPCEYKAAVDEFINSVLMAS